MRERQITKAVQAHDRMLFCKKDNGILHIFRKDYWPKLPNHICSLTHNWQITGRPVDWGLEPIVNRLKAHDMWNRTDYMDELLRGYERDKESQERDMRNTIESFLLDFRGQFAKATNDVNTSTLEKTDKRRLSCL